MKKISSLIFGLAFATVAAYSSPCMISASAVSATTCTATAPTNTAAQTVSGLNYGFGGVTPTIGASWSQSVIADPSNPFGAGDDTYVLTLTNITGTGIEHVTLANFSWASGIEVATGSGITATTVTDIQGIISFNFTPTELTSATTQEQLIVYTNTTAYLGNGTSGIIDGTAGSAQALAPAPEPTSMTLFGGALALLGAFRLRRK